MEELNNLRQENGVRFRLFGHDDEWANEHRKYLDNQIYIQDIDYFESVPPDNIEIIKCENRVFQEYEPDPWQNRNNLIREYGLIAIFDRKKNIKVLEESIINKKVEIGFSLHLCRLYSQCQPIPTRFFFVIGEHSPWTIREVDIYNGDYVGKDETLFEGVWKELWDKLGLIDNRNQLKKWLHCKTDNQ